MVVLGVKRDVNIDADRLNIIVGKKLIKDNVISVIFKGRVRSVLCLHNLGQTPYQ